MVSMFPEPLPTRLDPRLLLPHTTINQCIIHQSLWCSLLHGNGIQCTHIASFTHNCRNDILCQQATELQKLQT